MVIYNTKYSDDVCSSTRKNEYFHFGIMQFSKLCYYLGFPKDKRAEKIILENCLYKVYKKGVLLIKEGDSGTPIQFIINGGVKVFNGYKQNEKILSLIGSGGIVGSLSNLWQGLPSNYSFQTCNECKVLEMDGNKLQLLFKLDKQAIYKPMFERLLSLALNHQKEVSKLLRMNNKEKVKTIYSDYAHLFNSFNVKEIASFVNMKPESFSRMRKIIMGDK